MVHQATRQISIKGIREGLLIALSEEGSFDEQLAELTAELADKQDFLRGSRVALAVGRRRLNGDALSKSLALLENQGMVLWAVLAETAETKEAARDLGLATRLSGSNTGLDGQALERTPRAPEPSPNHERPAPAAKQGKAEFAGSNSLMLKETLRSGRSVYHEGHVIVIGDVNPGAEVIAGGDVVVWGTLRGLVHAGAHGDTSAVICALELIPTQLRIADQIAISPREQQRQPIPEKVAIHDGQIVAETWRTKH